MDAFTEDEKVHNLASQPPCRADKSDNVLQRFVLAEYIKASQVETGQLVEFISESAAPALAEQPASRCATMLTVLVPQKRTIYRLTGSRCSCQEVSRSILDC